MICTEAAEILTAAPQNIKLNLDLILGIVKQVSTQYTVSGWTTKSQPIAPSHRTIKQAPPA
jgi:hypothetical protein